MAGLMGTSARRRDRDARQKPGCKALGASVFEKRRNGAAALDRCLAGRVDRVAAAARRADLALALHFWI